MKAIILIFSIFFLLLACKREKMWFNDTTVEGVILDSATFEPFNNIKVELYKYKDIGWIWPSHKKVIIKTRNTDESGRFIIKFNKVNDIAYYISIYYNLEYDAYINGINTNDYPYPPIGEIDSIIKYKYIYLVKE